MIYSERLIKRSLNLIHQDCIKIEHVGKATYYKITISQEVRYDELKGWSCTCTFWSGYGCANNKDCMHIIACKVKDGFLLVTDNYEVLENEPPVSDNPDIEGTDGSEVTTRDSGNID